MRHFSANLVVRFLGIVAVLLALAGATSHAAMQLRAATAQARGELIEVCTSSGFVHINTATGKHQPAPTKTAHWQCDLCTIHAGVAIAPPAIASSLIALTARFEPYRFVSEVPRAASVRAPAQPRAPPVLS